MDARQYKKYINRYTKILSITGMSIGECAEIAGCSRGYLSAILNHKMVASDSMIHRISQAMERLLQEYGFCTEPQRCRWKRLLKTNGITQLDVANAIGVSRGTVSRVLNSGRMTKQMETKLQAYMSDLRTDGSRNQAEILGGGTT